MMAAAGGLDDSKIEGLSCQLNCESKCIDFLRSAVRVMAGRAGMDERRCNRISLAVDELFANIAEHGYGGRPGTIEFAARIECAASGGRKLCFEFRDYAGNPWRYEPGKSGRPKAGGISPGGLGLGLIEAVADGFTQTPLEDGNRWRLEFVLSGEGDCEA